MEGLNRFDTGAHGAVRLVVVERHLLPPAPFVVVIPLLRDDPAVGRPNPKIHMNGRQLFLAIRLIGPVRRARGRCTGSFADQVGLITRATDVPMEGFRPFIPATQPFTERSRPLPPSHPQH